MLLYFTGSMIMNKPSKECITDFWAEGILKNLPVSSSNPNFIKAASLLRDSCEDSTVCEKKLCDDFTRLFDRDELSLAPPFESYFRIKKYSESENQLFSVTEFYKSYGWESQYLGNLMDDHLGTELLFLTRLIEKYTVFDDEVCLAEMRSEIRRFIKTHLLSWIYEWNNYVQEYSETTCFKGIAALVIACTEDIYALLNRNQF
ncbi:MAG: molecular chaperone TorD family protein [Bacteroidales bacterium]|nr:molecular chaperone TorD family protein [Bacteroidales bacterium]